MDRRRFLAAAGRRLARARARPAAPGGPARRLPLALVTADLESHVVALDFEPAGRRGAHPHRAGAAQHRGSSGRPRPASRGPHGARRRHACSAPRRSRLRAELDGFEEPRYAARSHPRRARRSPTSRTRRARRSSRSRSGRGRVLSRTRVPGPARHVSISPTVARSGPCSATAAAGIAVLDASDARRPQLVRTFAPPFLAHDVVFAPDGRTVWVTSGSERRIALYSGGRRPGARARRRRAAAARRPSRCEQGVRRERRRRHRPPPSARRDAGPRGARARRLLQRRVRAGHAGHAVARRAER